MDSNEKIHAATQAQFEDAILQRYSLFVANRAKKMGSILSDLLHAGIGVSGEAGELLDSLKKSWVYGSPVDFKNLVEEAGDCLFYLQMLCNTLEVPMLAVIQQNMDKLMRRYPEGYSDAAALARMDKIGESAGAKPVTVPEGAVVINGGASNA